MPQTPHLTRLATVGALTALLAWAPSAAAQTAQSSAAAPTETRENPQHHNATTTASGTTGIWFVPTAEVLPNRAWSASLYRTNIDDGQGFSDISTFPITFAWGLGGRAELFGSWQPVTRIDRDTRPLFFTNSAGGAKAGTGGGLLVDYPLMHSQWTGNKRGDLWLGGKVNLLAGSSAPVAVAVRAMAKVPVGDDGAGVSTGKPDFEVDGIVSGCNPVAEVSGYGGVLVRGNPADYTLTNGFRWGVGAAFPQKYSLGLRVTAELFGERYFDDVIHRTGRPDRQRRLVRPDRHVAQESDRRADRSDVAGAGRLLHWRGGQLESDHEGPERCRHLLHGRRHLPAGRDGVDAFTNTPKDGAGLQIRIGFHPGSRGRRTSKSRPRRRRHRRRRLRRRSRPPTARRPCARPAIPAPSRSGRRPTVSADAQDPDGDPLTYQWSTPAGTLACPPPGSRCGPRPASPAPCPSR